MLFRAGEMVFLNKSQNCALAFLTSKTCVSYEKFNEYRFPQVASMKKEKEIKRQTLLELVDYVNTSAGQKIFSEGSMPVQLGATKGTRPG